MTSPLDREPVVVFTCGRTGSTLLIRILNCLPETVVWGEHGGILNSILQAHAHSRDVAGNRFITQAAQLLPDVLSRRAIRNRGPMSIEWLNWFNQDDMDDLYRNFIINLFYPSSIQSVFKRWGFKEVRYRTRVYEGLCYLFPNWKPIILYRNPFDIFRSQFKSFAQGDMSRIPILIGNITGFYDFAASIAAASNGAKTEVVPLFINYETMVWQFDETIASLEAYLDEEFSPQIDLIRADVDKFRKRHTCREPGAASDVEHELGEWAASAGAELPQEKCGKLAHDYEALTRALAGREVGA